jgi:hypothetical protein
VDLIFERDEADILRNAVYERLQGEYDRCETQSVTIVMSATLSTGPGPKRLIFGLSRIV